ncbi:hypothetical protein JCM8547_003735 [Rhodosporidiobolus lusitaniae]
MPVPSTVMRAAAHAARRSASSSAASSKPSLRTASTPSASSSWEPAYRPGGTMSAHRQPVLPDFRQLSAVELEKPPFQNLKDNSVFAHPKVVQFLVERQRSEMSADKERAGRGKRAPASLSDFERHEQLGKEFLKMVVSELLYQKYRDMAPQDVDRVRKALLSSTNLSSLAQHYNLAQFLPGRVAESLANRPSILASLFRAYAGGLHLQEGMSFARQWLRQCFRASINEEYDRLRANIEKAEETKERKAKQTPSAIALMRLNEWLRKRRIKPSWNVLTRGEGLSRAFRAELSFMGVKTVGVGTSVAAAKQAAAVVALRHLDIVTPKPHPQQHFERLEDPSAVVWAMRLHEWTGKRHITAPQYNTTLTVSPIYQSEVTVDREVFKATGIGKRLARANAAKVALSELAPELFELYLEADRAKEDPTATPSLLQARTESAAIEAILQAADEPSSPSTYTSTPASSPPSQSTSLPADLPSPLWSNRLYDWCLSQQGFKPAWNIVEHAHGTWVFEVDVGGQVFQGRAKGKKVARAAAGRAALRELAPSLAEQYEKEDKEKKAQEAEGAPQTLKPSASSPTLAPATASTPEQVEQPSSDRPALTPYNRPRLSQKDRALLTDFTILAPVEWSVRLHNYCVEFLENKPVFRLHELGPVRFKAEVEVQGKAYEGEESKVKKFARANAAMAAMKEIAPAWAKQYEEEDARKKAQEEEEKKAAERRTADVAKENIPPPVEQLCLAQSRPVA